jgi:hypothetical protein
MAVAAAKVRDWVRLLALVEENPQSEHLQCIIDSGIRIWVMMPISLCLDDATMHTHVFSCLHPLV